MTAVICRFFTEKDRVAMVLDDLIYFRNLKELRIGLVELDNIDFVPYLENLKQLYINSCELEDITPLSELKNDILFTSLRFNKISDLSSLKNINQGSLYLDHNNISDISVFGEMEKLPHEIVLSYNNISDISALAPNGRDGHLAYLNLRDNNISDISPLKDYVNISILSLTNNNITDVSPLVNLSKHNNIYLVNNPVENYEVLKGFTNLAK